MICLVCRRAETADGITAVQFERGELKLVVKNVPAHVCPSCGEAYLEEDVAARLLSQAEAMSAAGTLHGVLDFDTKRPNDKIRS